MDCSFLLEAHISHRTIMIGKNWKIRFVRNFTVEPLGEALKDRTRELGLNLTFSYGAYDNVVPEILETAGSDDPPDFLIVALDIEFFAGGIYNPQWTLEQARGGLLEMFAALESIPARTQILLATFIPPFRLSLPWAPGHPILGRNTAAFSLNQLIRGFVAEHAHRCGLLDFERLAAQLGEAETLDRRFGLMMKAPFRSGFINAAAEAVLRYLRLRFEPPKKVLILDCDNTLWGGVVGECGAEGIELDPYEYPGIAYYRFQFEVLALAEQGVLICLCSKNDEAAVWEVLERHPHCLIKRNHLAGFRINWTDKAANIKGLAEELNLSVDSMVFVDDNPAECELARSSFPGLSVLQVPGKIYNFPGMLAATGWFERQALNQEDKERTRYYQAEQGRRETQKQHGNLESFLRDLAMRAVVRPLETPEISRAAQLCQRTNQFNLTTRRYTDAELGSLREDPSARIYTLQAADRFGPVGFSGLIMYRKDDSLVEIDTFLLSCRIIGRQFERALFCESLRLLSKEWVFTKLQARYIPTPKNSVVSGLWPEFGFQPSPGGEDGVFCASPASLEISPPPMIEITDKL